jgi:ATP/maltotriose-dependent transcriptional regulator MalT
MALLPFERGDFDESRRMIDESQRFAAGRSVLIDAVNLWMYAQLESETGRIDEAIELSQRSAARADEIGWTWWVSGQRLYLARLALRADDVAGAEREARTALEIARAHENRLRSSGALSALAQAALARGEPERAGVLWGAAESEFRTTPTRADLEWFGGSLLAEDGALFRNACERGRQLDFWDAVGIALGELELPQTVP